MARKPWYMRDPDWYKVSPKARANRKRGAAVKKAAVASANRRRKAWEQRGIVIPQETWELMMKATAGEIDRLRLQKIRAMFPAVDPRKDQQEKISEADIERLYKTINAFNKLAKERGGDPVSLKHLPGKRESLLRLLERREDILKNKKDWYFDWKNLIMLSNFNKSLDRVAAITPAGEKVRAAIRARINERGNNWAIGVLKLIRQQNVELFNILFDSDQGTALDNLEALIRYFDLKELLNDEGFAAIWGETDMEEIEDVGIW